MLDKVLATISILSLIGFMSIVTVFVNEPDLWIIVIIVLIMASVDFFKTIKKNNNSGDHK